MGAGTAARLGFAPPSAGPGVCATCRGPVRDGRVECWCCRTVAHALGRVAGRVVVPVAVFRAGDPLHVVLRGYKDAEAVSVRRHFARGLAGHFRLFLEAEGDCLASAAKGRWDCVAVVPSSGDAAGGVPRRGGGGHREVPHPLDAVVDAVPVLAGLPRLALRRGPAVCGHLAPDTRAFAVSGELRGRRVLLLDDTWVTGARMVSAATALEAAGAAVVAMVVAGRFVEVRPSTKTWWERVAEDDARGPLGIRCALAPLGRVLVSGVGQGANFPGNSARGAGTVGGARPAAPGASSTGPGRCRGSITTECRRGQCPGAPEHEACSMARGVEMAHPDPRRALGGGVVSARVVAARSVSGAERA